MPCDVDKLLLRFLLTIITQIHEIPSIHPPTYITSALMHLLNIYIYLIRKGSCISLCPPAVTHLHVSHVIRFTLKKNICTHFRLIFPSALFNPLYSLSLLDNNNNWVVVYPRESHTHRFHQVIHNIHANTQTYKLVHKLTHSRRRINPNGSFKGPKSSLKPDSSFYMKNKITYNLFTANRLLY